MIKRTIEISSPAGLSIRHQQLLISQDTGNHSIPFEDIGFLILDHPRIMCSIAVFRACAKHDAVLIVTDESHTPSALLHAFAPHSLQGKITKMQAQTPQDIQDVLWQRIIEHKISAQFATIKLALAYDHPRLERLAKGVKLGDRLNYEAQAAKIYFPALFGQSFRRQPALGGRNALLNYGYSIIRSACARALMGAGLNPIFGLKHTNQYNPFCLADDIMEPLRPMVDLCIYQLTEHKEIKLELDTPIDKKIKIPLLSLLNQGVSIGTKSYPLMSSLELYCASLRKALQQRKGTLLIPKFYE